MARPSSSNLIVRKRLLIIFFLIAFVIVGLTLRLGWIQFVMAEELKQQAWEQWNRHIPAQSSRGDIYDRHGNLLAGSATVDTVVAIPPQIEDPSYTASALSEVLEMEEQRIYDLITQERAAVYVKRKIKEDQAREIRLLNLPGISFTQEAKRYYPNNRLSSQLLGFVGVDQGLSGLELSYEEELKGSDGSIVLPTDNRGREIPGIKHFIPPREGKNLYLTIDETIQFILERELSKAMIEYDPDRVMGMAVDPQTGEVLAASSKPDYDPNEYIEYERERWRLFPVTDTFEPGSTFKLVTLTAAIEEDLYRRDEDFYCSGSKEVAGNTIRCWTSHKGGHGSINYLEAVLGSCNPAFITLGEKLGKEKLYEYITGLGFGSPTGIDYPGEGGGLIFTPEQMGALELATSSFGQGVSATPLQQIMAVSAIANGGKLLEPYIVKEKEDPNEGAVETASPQVKREVISEETSKEVSSIMEKVVAEGSGANAAVEGYKIAGKTGTAQKVGPDGSYLPGEYILSFIGFAPVEDPEVLLYVAVDGAKRGPQWGSQISAPLFGDIMKDILFYLEVPPSDISEEEVEMVNVPDLRGMSIDEAGALLDDESLVLQMVGEEGVIVEQTPKPGASVPVKTSVISYLEDVYSERERGKIVMPNLKGMTLQEVKEISSDLNLVLEPSGSGIVVDQYPAPGTMVEGETVIEVDFQSPLN